MKQSGAGLCARRRQRHGPIGPERRVYPILSSTTRDSVLELGIDRTCASRDASHGNGIYRLAHLLLHVTRLALLALRRRLDFPTRLRIGSGTEDRCIDQSHVRRRNAIRQGTGAIRESGVGTPIAGVFVIEFRSRSLKGIQDALPPGITGMGLHRRLRIREITISARIDRSDTFAQAHFDQKPQSIALDFRQIRAWRLAGELVEVERSRRCCTAFCLAGPQLHLGERGQGEQAQRPSGARGCTANHVRHRLPGIRCASSPHPAPSAFPAARASSAAARRSGRRSVPSPGRDGFP
jgi:hypothetical protein